MVSMPDKKNDKTTRGTVDGGEGRGVPLGGRDERPPTGYDPRQQPNRDKGDDTPDNISVIPPRRPKSP